jgi:hypothetical protein
METETKRTPTPNSFDGRLARYDLGYAEGYSAAVADVAKWLHDEPFRGLLLSDPLRKAADAIESGEWKGGAKT